MYIFGFDIGLAGIAILFAIAFIACVSIIAYTEKDSDEEIRKKIREEIDRIARE